MSRRTLVVMLVVLGSLVAAVGAPSALAGSNIKTVAIGGLGETGFELVAKIDQTDKKFTIYGYLTHARGLDGSRLFTQPGIDQSAATSRITFYAKAKMTNRASVQNGLAVLFSVAAAGNATFYFNKNGGASFDDPASFRRGKTIGKAFIRVQNVINVQGVGPLGPTATSLASVGLTHTKVKTFRLNGKRYRFGTKNGKQRLRASGQGVLVDPLNTIATLFLAGTATTSRNPAS